MVLSKQLQKGIPKGYLFFILYHSHIPFDSNALY